MPSRNQFTFAAVPIPLTRGPFPQSFSFAPPSMSCFRFRASNCHRSTYMIQCHCSIENSIDSSSSRRSHVLPQSLESGSAPSRSHTWQFNSIQYTNIVSPSRAMQSLSHVVHSTSMLKFAVRSPSSSVRIVISLSSSCSFLHFRLISASNRFRNSFSVIQLQFKFNSRLLRFSLVPFGAGSPSITSGSNSNYVRTLRRSTIRIQQSTRKIVEFQVNQVVCYQLPIRVASVARSRRPPSWRKKNRIDPSSRIE